MKIVSAVARKPAGGGRGLRGDQLGRRPQCWFLGRGAVRHHRQPDHHRGGQPLTARNLLFPGNAGDAVVTIANPNPYPVTITAVNLPTSAIQAGGFTTSALTTAQTGCSTTTSGVTWNFATGTSGTSHTLTTALTVGASGAANNPLVVTLTNDALMATASPAACANTFFSMPRSTGVTATGGSATSTTSPATDAWTS